ncbi:hypothetical protein U0035_15180 [Niabella yanshanensis]|uniref:PH domain-containing protein n=1 Tax=Niabella yanshanensis TaxID=577386 RepID=A0ABZ0W269_9BACT|nr:hypothetical protein [Niabella yanshanensis]WQD37014.1 hypothetical protein U0035_15180 [Niabella yanshanensis]
MLTVTVSEAIKKSNRIVVVPVLLCLAPILPLIWLFDHYKVSAVWGLIVIVSCFVLMILAGLYFTLKWEIWALQHVDDIKALKTRVENRPFSMGFPAKWKIGSKSRKLLVQELWEERSSRTPLYRPAISYDYTLPDEIAVYGSRIQYGAFALCLLAMPFISYSRITDKYQLYLVLPVELIAIIFFLYKTIFPGLKLKLSAKGIWLPKTGHVKWEEISRIYIKDELDQDAALTAFLCFTKKQPLLSKEIIFKIRNLNLTSSKLEYAIKNYLSAYNKKASEPLHFG